jgi:F420 biosynthesis protein FbiB-like protein
MDDMDAYPDVRRQEAERTMAVQSVALAAGQVLLAAHAEGLGSCWMCAPLFAPGAVREALGLPDSWEPQGLVVLGYPAEPGRETSRRDLEDVMVWR